MFSFCVFKKKGKIIRLLFSFILTMFLCMQPYCLIFAQTEEGKEEGLEISAPRGVLLELSTGKVIYEKGADEVCSPASITKIMTLLLIFQELEKGNLKLEDEVTTSAYAKSMGGSQVFLEEGEKQTVETMIKCIVIASGNDASVAMAEHIAGSEGEFVARMNQKAKELGMENTHFKDCCGLTDSPEHHTSARDVGIMSRELVLHYPEILNYSSIWMENITHETSQGKKEFTLSNTNKLVRAMEECKGLKTGSTSVAKYCVSAVAQKENLTLIAVVMGAPEPKGRFRDASAMLRYGFGCCHIYSDNNEKKLSPVPVKGGIEEKVQVEFQEPFAYVDTEGKNLQGIEKQIHLHKEVQAPIKKGQIVGKADYMLDGEKIGSVNIIARKKVKKAGFKDCLWKAGTEFLLTS